MQKLIKPREGLIVRHPKTYGILQKQGELVEWGGAAGRYWRRRVKCGDVVVVKQDEIVEQDEKVPRTTSPKTKKKEDSK